jgi:hypothetical protein
MIDLDIHRLLGAIVTRGADMENLMHKHVAIHTKILLAGRAPVPAQGTHSFPNRAGTFVLNGFESIGAPRTDCVVLSDVVCIQSLHEYVR